MNAARIAFLLTGVVATALLAVTAVAKAPVRLSYNATESAAVGFYSVARPGQIRVSDQVLSWLPPPIADLADQRRYVPATIPVLKTLAAGPGDVVCRMGAEVSIDGLSVARTRSLDRAGRPLPVWSGCYRLSLGQIFLLGPNPSSFDGRYFGPTPAALILGRARPLWTW